MKFIEISKTFHQKQQLTITKLQKQSGEINGLRGIAVISVIIYHFKSEILPGGFLGVDVFFVLSGYLIARRLYTDSENGDFSLRNFYTNRVQRIVPALLGVLCFTTFLSLLLHHPSAFVNFSQSVIATIILNSNLLFHLESGYFGPTNELKPLLHTWSLSIEEQFYLIAPLLILFTKRKFLFILFALSFIFAQIISISENNTLSFFLSPFRFWELLIGVATFRIEKTNLYLLFKNKQTAVEYFEFISLIGLVSCFFLFTSKSFHPGFLTFLPCFFTAVLILDKTGKTLVKKLLGMKYLVLIGLISYSLYLYHLPIIAFYRYLNPLEIILPTLLALMAISFILALSSWYFIEIPNRYLKLNQSRARRYLLICLVLCIISTLGVNTAGLPARFAEVSSGSVDQSEFFASIKLFPLCDSHEKIYKISSYKGIVRCRQSTPGKPSTVIIGDSHAEALFVGLSGLHSTSNSILPEPVAYYLSEGPPIISNKKFNQVHTLIMENSQIKNVIVTSRWAEYFKENTNFPNLLEQTLNEYALANKKITIISDVPNFPFMSEQCKYINKLTEKVPICNIPLSEYQYQKSYYENSLKSISQSLGATLIDLDSVFCDKESCSMSHKGIVYFRDKDHLNIEGSKIVGEFISKILIQNSLKRYKPIDLS